MENKEAKKIAQGARSVTIAVLFSRLLGLLREQILATLFGAGFQMDAYVVAYRIPNLLRDLFAEGALASAFVKVFSEWKEKQGLDDTWKLARKAIGSLAFITFMIVIIGEILAPFLVKLFAPGFSSIPGKLSLAITLTRIMFPFLLLISLSAILGGMLNCLGIFFLPAISSAFFNLISIIIGVSFYWLLPRWGFPEIMGMAFGVLAGGISQILIQYPQLIKKGFSFRWEIDFSHPGIKEIFRLMAPSIIGLSAVQLNVFINTYFASLCGQGAVSWLAYAFRLMYVPLGLFGVAIQVAILPLASQQTAQGDLSGLKRTYSSGIIMGMALALPSAIGLIILSHPIVKVIFEHGRFTSVDTANTAAALSLFSVGLIAYALTKVSVPIFYALGRPKIPMIGSFIAVGINIFVVWKMVKVWNFKAIALGTSLGLIGQALFLFLLLDRILQGINIFSLLFKIIRLIFCALSMGGVAWLFRHKLMLSSTSGGHLFLFLFLGIGSCALFYFLLAWAIAPPEALYFLFRFRRKDK